MLIRVPGQSKRVKDVITFETTEEKHVNGIVRQLNALYDGQPVGSVRIGKAYGMGHCQVLIYLHKARDAELATPVLSSAGGVIRGWVPARVGAVPTLAERRAMRAADAVKALATEGPVSTRAVGRHLDVSYGTIRRWLQAAERMGLIRRSSAPRGWEPA